MKGGPPDKYMFVVALFWCLRMNTTLREPGHKHQVTRFMVHEASPDLFGSRQNKGTLPWLWELVGIVGCRNMLFLAIGLP
uniref:Uncharacterized protein n=1 Tax=Bionectria ochroleuca TaxID=29856 RepID=A0A0B7JTZ1_BIOOC